MAESDAVRIAREYRQQLVNNEDAALKQMSRYWLDMERSMTDQFKLLKQEIDELRSAGVAVPKQYIRTLHRYQYMLAQLQQNLGEFSVKAERIIERNQRENYILGLDSATEIITATKPTASIWNRVNNEAAELMVGFAGNGAPLGELLRHDYADSASDILDALVSGIALGKGTGEVAKDMAEAMQDDYRRAVLIARTETNRAYRIANAEQYAASGVVTRVLRLCYPPTACFACLMMDGEECPNGICDDHPNGKCTTVVETVGGVRPDWETGKEWFLKQSEEDQRRIMGAGHYDLWKNQGVPLRNMVTMKVNPVWGGNPSVKPLKDLQEEFRIPDSKEFLTPNDIPVYPSEDHSIIEAFKRAEEHADEFRIANPVPPEPPKALPIWNPYQEAKEGGTNANLIIYAQTQATDKIESSIQKWQKRIDEHFAKVKSLQDRIESGYEIINKRHVDGLFRYWHKEAITYAKQRDVYKGILKERGKND